MEQLIVGKSLEMQLAALLDTLPSDAIVSYMVTRLNEGEEATIELLLRKRLSILVLVW